VLSSRESLHAENQMRSRIAVIQKVREAHFIGREREMAGIRKALTGKRNLVVTGKFGIGRTSLIKQFARLNDEQWRFLFADFSQPPAKVCHDLLSQLKPKSHDLSRRRIRSLGYKRTESLIISLASKDNRQYVVALDNIEKLTSQRLTLIRDLVRARVFIFVAIAEPFLPEEDLFQLRVCLYPSTLLRLRNLSSEQTARFFRYLGTKNHFPWTESDIHVLSLAAKGYPLAMREFVTRALERRKRA